MWLSNYFILINSRILKRIITFNQKDLILKIPGTKVNLSIKLILTALIKVCKVQYIFEISG